MIYYGIVIILALIFLFGVEIIYGVPLEMVLIFIGIGGVMFSAYLTYVQFFVLRATCDYCLASAATNLLILVVELI